MTMKKIKWLAALGVVTMVIAVCMIPGWRSHRWEKLIQQRFADYHRRGEPASIADLADSPANPAENAALDLRAAATSVARSTTAWNKLVYPKRDEKLTVQQKRELGAQVELENAAVLARIDSASSKPALDWAITPVSPLLNQKAPDLSAQRELANLLTHLCIADHLRGQDASALKQIARLQLQVRAMGRYPVTGLIAHLIAIAFRSMIADDAIQIAADLHIGDGDGAASRKHVQDLIAWLADIDALKQSFRQAIFRERVQTWDATQTLTQAGAPGATSHWPVVCYIRRSGFLADAVLVLDVQTSLAGFVDEADLPAATAKLKPLLATVDHASDSRPVLRLATALNLSLKVEFRMRTDQLLAATALAIRLYAMDHAGRMPSSLNELVPTYLPSVPIDPMAAGAVPIHYLPGEPDPRIYSVGYDGVDNGGSEVPLRSNSDPDYRWDCKDAVVHLWPTVVRSPATRASDN